MLMGASRVIALDCVPERLDMARKLGADAFNFNELDPVKAIHQMCGGLDRAIDCAGFRYAKSAIHKIERAVGMETDTSEVLNEMIKCVKKFGTISIIADYAGYANHFLVGGLMEKGIRMIGCGQAPTQKYWKELLNDVSYEVEINIYLLSLDLHSNSIHQIFPLFIYFPTQHT